MKRIIILSGTFITLCACSLEVDTFEPKVDVFCARTDVARTVLRGTDVIWKCTDEISIFPSTSANDRFVAKEISDEGRSAVFAGTTDDVSVWYALSPYMESASLDSQERIRASIPTQQTFTDGSFADGANVAVAMSTDRNLAFKNIGALVSFTLEAASIKTIKLSSEGSVMSGGLALISYNDGIPVVEVSSGSDHVEMSGAFAIGTTYYAVVYPGTYNGFSLTFTTIDGVSKTISNPGSCVIPRCGNIYLGHLDPFGKVPSAAVSSPDIFVAGRDGYHTYRIPALVKSTRGSLLAFCEGRKNSSSDSGDIDLVLRRSVDGGETWSPLIKVWDDGDNTCGNPAPVVDPVSGRIHLLMTWNLGTDLKVSQFIDGSATDTRRPFYCYSDDDGQTWSTPVDLTSSVKKDSWGWYATGPCHAIILKKAPYAGRIVIPCDYITKTVSEKFSTVIYSDDNGSTWQAGGSVPGGNECSVAELSDGRLSLSCRQGSGCRQHALSSDGGTTWTSLIPDKDLPDPVCQASMLGEDIESSRVLFFFNPADKESRIKGSLRVSFDDGASWSDPTVVFPEKAGYSDLVKLNDVNIGILGENGSGKYYEKISFVSLPMSEISLNTPVISVKGTSTFAGASEPLVFEGSGFCPKARLNWEFAGGTPSSTTGSSASVNYAANGRYDVTLTASVGPFKSSITKEKFVSVYPDKPLLFLPFDGDYEDHSENGIEVTRVDGPSATEYLGLTQAGHTGIAGSSAYFPGFNNTKYSVLRITDDTFASKFNSSGNYTISFWFKGRSTKTGNQTLFSQGTGDAATGWHYMRIDNDGTAGAGQKYRLIYQLKYSNAVDDDCSIQYKYNYNGDGKTSHTGVTADLRDGKWHNICVRVMVENSDKYEAGGKAMSWKLFIDGQGPINNNAQKVKTLSSYIPFVIGAKDVSGTLSDPVQGNIDDFIIWNRTIGNADMASFSNY